MKFGIALTFYKMGSRPIQIGAPDHTFDYLGVPELTPNYSFGLARTPPHVLTTSSPDLVAQIRAEFHDPARARSPSPAPSGMLRTIAAIQITQRRYVVTLAGMATIDGHTDYDLHLTPVTDPSHYRLRELWVDAKSFATDRLVTQGDFTAGELAALRWTVDFQQIEGAPFVESEHTSSAFTFDRRHYDDAAVSFTNIAVRAMPSYASLATFAVDPETAPEILIEPPAPRD